MIHRQLLWPRQSLLIMVRENLQHQWWWRCAALQPAGRAVRRRTLHRKRCLNRSRHSLACGPGVAGGRRESQDALFAAVGTCWWSTKHTTWVAEDQAARILSGRQLAETIRAPAVTATRNSWARQYFARLRLLDPNRFHAWRRSAPEENYRPVAEAVQELRKRTPVAASP